MNRLSDATPQYTDEQADVLDAMKSDENGVIEAYAGAGKTFILKEGCEDRPRKKFFYVAYNRAIADDAKKSFPRNATCRTMHSVAFQAVGVKYKHKLNGPRQRWNDIAKTLGIHEAFKLDDTPRYLRTAAQAGLVLDTLRRFCYSADEQIEPHHVPRLPGTEVVYEQLSRFIAAKAIIAWRDITNRDGVNISWGKSHDYYLKMWALEHPIIRTDCLMVDEAQDSNGLVMGVVMEQDCQKILVGDRFQQLYAWRGAQDAMAGFDADWRRILSQSFRFGEAVANEGDKWLQALGAEKKLRGFDQIQSEIKEYPHAQTVLCRTNATVIAEAMQLQETAKSFAIVGGTGEIMAFARAVQQLQANSAMSEKDRVAINHPDLMAFESWEEVKEYAQSEGTDLRVLVDMVDRYGVAGIMRVANEAISDEDRADHILSTAHKAKGREWDSVRIASDFRQPEPDEETGEIKVDKPEFMLLYVACTRAQRVLDNTSVNWIDDFLGLPKVEQLTDDNLPTGAIAKGKAKARKRKRRITND